MTSQKLCITTELGHAQHLSEPLSTGAQHAGCFSSHRCLAPELLLGNQVFPHTRGWLPMLHMPLR